MAASVGERGGGDSRQIVFSKDDFVVRIQMDSYIFELSFLCNTAFLACRRNMINFKETFDFKQTSDPRIKKVTKNLIFVLTPGTHYSAFAHCVLKHVKPQVGLLMLL